jgi:hypothetical protein
MAAKTIVWEIKTSKGRIKSFKWYTPVDLVVDAVQMLALLLALGLDEQPVVEQSTTALPPHMARVNHSLVQEVDMYLEEVEWMEQLLACWSQPAESGDERHSTLGEPVL